MFQWSGEAGLGVLFAASFVSATVLPANSELVLAAFLKAFPDRSMEALVVATAGNTLGGLTTYGLGRLLPQRTVPTARSLAWVRRHGAPVLLVSWVPVIGDALCAAAGWLRVPLPAAALALALGKLARYAVVVQAVSLI